MFLQSVVQSRIKAWMAQVRRQMVLPLRVELWNGQQLDFSPDMPRVTIRVPQPSAARYLLSPALASLGAAYVEGAISSMATKTWPPRSKRRSTTSSPRSACNGASRCSTSAAAGARWRSARRSVLVRAASASHCRKTSISWRGSGSRTMVAAL